MLQLIPIITVFTILLGLYLYDIHRDKPKFKSGDLITIPTTEEWEEKSSVLEVVKVGNEKYLLRYTSGILKDIEIDHYMSLVDMIYKKVE